MADAVEHFATTIVAAVAAGAEPVSTKSAMTHLHTYIMREEVGTEDFQAPNDEAAERHVREVLSEDWRRDDRSATA